MNSYDKNHRTGIDIIVNILEYVDSRGAVLKTHILYGANLNSKSLEKYLKKLILTGLLTKNTETGKEKYLITSRGRIFLQHLGRALNMLRGNEESMVTLSLKKMLENKAEGLRIREGIMYKGNSGMHYMLSSAFTQVNKGKEEIVALMEVINSGMSSKEVISIVGWVWIISKDMKIPAVVLVSEKHADMVNNILSFAENELRNGIRIVKYNDYESPKAIALKIITNLAEI